MYVFSSISQFKFSFFRPFSKVLPLPSDCWQEVAENWFCHKEKNDVPDVHRLQPRQDDVLIGETDFYMALNKSVPHSFRLKEGSGNMLCDRCAEVVGTGKGIVVFYLGVKSFS
jgi:hypothetical protein